MIAPKPEITLEDIKFAYLGRGMGKQTESGEFLDLNVNIVRFSTPCFSTLTNEDTDLFVLIEDKDQSASTVLKEARAQLNELFTSLAQMLDDEGWEGRE